MVASSPFLCPSRLRLSLARSHERDSFHSPKKESLLAGYRPSCELPYEIPAPVPDGKYFDNLTHAQSSIHLEVEHGCRVMNESREIISDTFSNFISMCGTQICSITGEAIRTSRRLRKNSQTLKRRAMLGYALCDLCSVCVSLHQLCKLLKYKESTHELCSKGFV